MSSSDRRPHVFARRPAHGAILATITWGTMINAETMSEERASFAVRERLAGERLHRRVGHLEQEHAAGECEQAAVLPKAPARCSRRCARPLVIWDARGAAAKYI